MSQQYYSTGSDLVGNGSFSGSGTKSPTHGGYGHRHNYRRTTPKQQLYTSNAAQGQGSGYGYGSSAGAGAEGSSSSSSTLLVDSVSAATPASAPATPAPVPLPALASVPAAGAGAGAAAAAYSSNGSRSNSSDSSGASSGGYTYAATLTAAPGPLDANASKGPGSADMSSNSSGSSSSSSTSGGGGLLSARSWLVLLMVVDAAGLGLITGCTVYDAAELWHTEFKYNYDELSVMLSAYDIGVVGPSPSYYSLRAHGGESHHAGLTGTSATSSSSGSGSGSSGGGTAMAATLSPAGDGDGDRAADVFDFDSLGGLGADPVAATAEAEGTEPATVAAVNAEASEAVDAAGAGTDASAGSRSGDRSSSSSSSSTDSGSNTVPILCWFSGRFVQVVGLLALIGHAATLQRYHELEVLGMFLLTVGPILNIVAALSYDNNNHIHYPVWDPATHSYTTQMFSNNDHSNPVAAANNAIFNRQWCCAEVVELVGILLLDLSIYLDLQHQHPPHGHGYAPGHGLGHGQNANAVVDRGTDDEDSTGKSKQRWWPLCLSVSLPQSFSQALPTWLAAPALPLTVPLSLCKQKQQGQLGQERWWWPWPWPLRARLQSCLVSVGVCSSGSSNTGNSTSSGSGNGLLSVFSSVLPGPGAAVDEHTILIVEVLGYAVLEVAAMVEFVYKERKYVPSALLAVSEAQSVEMLNGVPTHRVVPDALRFRYDASHVTDGVGLLLLTLVAFAQFNMRQEAALAAAAGGANRSR